MHTSRAFLPTHSNSDRSSASSASDRSRSLSQDMPQLPPLGLPEPEDFRDAAPVDALRHHGFAVRELLGKGSFGEVWSLVSTQGKGKDEQEFPGQPLVAKLVHTAEQNDTQGTHRERSRAVREAYVGMQQHSSLVACVKVPPPRGPGTGLLARPAHPLWLWVAAAPVSRSLLRPAWFLVLAAAGDKHQLLPVAAAR
jgi:hypothetical protein